MSMRTVRVASFTLLLAGCASSPPTTAPPGEPAPAQTSAGETPPKPAVSAAQCESQGGTVVGDIGDGAIHRPDYKCPSGAAPSGSIAPPDGGPVPIEGAVCCPK